MNTRILFSARRIAGIVGLLLIAANPGNAAPAPNAKPMTVAFADDDYPKGLGEARAKKLPIFIEAWAPW